ncbi:phenylalanyl-tRNA synthetase alpha subunit [Keratinibaculum paraultunense]|uniref:Phenylalanine--tRNA ligase alpha subunit n=1 Tax=Keratinibaculum paraultunense TaxID=1278232 RepID=A0A4R3KZ61_9FIRM|nr:phenylalanine--tRNA ligase subunit alpha [Keratinibaculum paraultunense]QQY80374.1 phenylalanine--tRNA ligase subunit alpha [Keratinibaculum paraultunense]TCS90901.1 phenylalanyl-tRNA synthetase alpha subunit [Keratinibaculum paraultunense]
MKDRLKKIREDAIDNIKSANNLDKLEEIRVKYMGKKGELTLLLREMGKIAKEERPIIGRLANEIREEIEKELFLAKERIKEEIKAERIEKEKIDISISKRSRRLGHRHPLLITIDELEDLFISMGFSVVEGPEIETVENNFDALNSPENHPSRDLTDTFYITEDILLRTHTSPVQIRAMKEMEPPLKIVSAGRTFRFDDVDDTHSPMFHQLEGLVVDENITMANLMHTINIFIKELFGKDMKTRFRPHYFPFTEPSAEVDVSCFKCKGEGCSVCNGTGWSMELLGCGMVHPKVLKNCGIDPEKYSGFAFGMGIDRITMVKYGIDNIRLLFENDNRFLEQF